MIRAEADIVAGTKSLSDFDGTLRDAVYELITLKEQLGETRQAMAPAVYDAMAQGMANLRMIIVKTQDGLVGTAEAAATLMHKLSNVINSAPDVQATFAWFNERGPQAFENWGIIAGNVLRGVLNLLRAFDPLAVSVEEGLISMTDRWAKWTAKLGESEKFQAFIDYVKENMPKITDIFGSAIEGAVNFFTGFAPLAADMLTYLQDLMNRWQEWSSTIGENKQFQEFIQFARDNAPQVIDFIVELVKFLTNVAIGFAEVGETLTPLITSFLEWANGLMESNRWMARLLPWMTVLAGAASMLYVGFNMLRLIFLTWTGVIGVVVNFLGTRLMPLFAMLTSKATTTGSVFRVFVSGMRNIIASAVPVIGAWFRLLGTQLVNLGIRFLGMSARIIDVFFNVISAVARFATRFIGFLVKIVGKAVWFGARIAAQWLIAMGPVGWVIAGVIALAAIIIFNWDRIVEFTKNLATTVAQKFIEIRTAVTQKVAEMVTTAVGKWEEFKANVKRKVAEMVVTARNK